MQLGTETCPQHGQKLSSYCAAKGCGEIVCVLCYQTHKCPVPQTRAFLSIDENLTFYYAFKRFLGKGSYGSVFQVENLSDSSVYALKVVPGVTEDQFASVKEKMALMNRARSPKIVQCLTSNYLSDKRLFAVLMELCDSSVEKVLPSLDAKTAMGYFGQICEGLLFLHCQCEPAVIHREITPSNILLKGNEIRLSGFWEARETLNMSASQDLGTPEYLAPEISSVPGDRKIKYNEKTDIWALGVLLYRMLSKNQHPFLEGVQSYGDALRKREPDFSLIPNETVKEILRRCLEKEPKNRADIGEVLKLLKEEVDLHKGEKKEEMQMPDVENGKKEMEEKKSQGEEVIPKLAKGEGPFNASRILPGHSFEVHVLCLSPDEKFLASGASDSTAKILGFPSGQLLQSFQLQSSVCGVCFSKPDGLKLFCGTYSHGIVEFDVNLGAQLRNIGVHPRSLECLDLSPDGVTLASASYNKSNIILWGVADGQPIWTLAGHSSFVYSLCFSPDAETLVSGSLDKTVKLWQVSSGTLLKTLKGHTGCVSSVQFSADGTKIASGAAVWDYTVRVWDVSSRTTLKTLKGHSGVLHSVRFSSDGSKIFSGAGEKTIRI